MKNKILPIIAGVLVIVAVLVVIFIPKNSKEGKSANAGSDSLQSTTNTTTNPTKKTLAKSTSKLATLDEEGNVIINKSDVSEDKISFLKYSEDSKIELIAIKGENGDVNVALGTCGSCNGSPKAYYNQSGDLLQCNNCGLTFPLDVIGIDGTGCHPIMIDESGITKTEEGITIRKDVLLKNESLFSKVVEH